MQAFITFSDCTAIVGFSVPKTAIPNKMPALVPTLAQGSCWTVQVLLHPYPVHLPVYLSVSCKFFKVASKAASACGLQISRACATGISVVPYGI